MTTSEPGSRPPAPENSVVITGVLVEEAQLRYSPAGIPIARFLIEHGSEQREARRERSIRFRIGVRAAGAELIRPLTGLPAGATLRVSGHLARARRHSGNSTLIVSAGRIQRLDTQ